MKQNDLISALLLIVIAIPSVSAQKINPVDIQKPVEMNKPEKGILPKSVVTEEKRTEQVRSIRGTFKITGALSDSDAASKFVMDYETLLFKSRFNDAAELETLTQLGQLRTVRAIGSRVGTYLSFARFYQGLPVFDEVVSVLVDSDRQISRVRSNLATISVPKPIEIPDDADREIVLQTAIDAVGAKGVAIGGKTAKGVIISKIGVETEPVAVWRVSFRTAVPAAAWRVFIDGSSKRVVSKYNVAQYQEPRGSVFAPNPVRTSRNPTLKDDPAGIPDGDSDELTKARSSVAINDLETGGNGLVGKYAVIVPSNLGTSPAFEPTGVFDYRRSDPRFEDVMAYHWVTENQRYVQSLGFEKAGNFQIRIDTHFTAADNSYYDPDEKSLQFGTGEVDDAEDGEVIIHEYAHAILDDQVPNFGGNQEGTEARAISEGFGDYWAASFFADSGAKEWAVFWAEWDGSAGSDSVGGLPPYLRRLDTQKTANDKIQNEHADGEIWSACLWMIRDQLGRTRADTLILGSHYRLNGGVRTFEAAANAILDEHASLEKDSPRFKKEQDAIRRIFSERLILP